jgi:hypothetical protein
MNQTNKMSEIASLLADSEAGVVEETKPDEETQETEETAEQTQSTEEVTESSEAVEKEGAEDPEKEGEQADAEEDPVYTLNDMASDYDKEVEDLYHVSVKLSKGDSMTIGQLKDFREENKDIEQIRVGFVDKEQALTEQAESLSVQSEEVGKTPGITNEFLQARATVLAISQSYDRVNWDELRVQKPGEWAALQQDFQNQFANAKQLETEAQNKVEQQTQSNAKFQQDRLFAAVPDLKDDAFRSKTTDSVVRYAGRYGITAKEVGDITDSRVMHMMIEAAKGVDAMKTAKEKIVPKEVPKAAKSAPAKPAKSDNSKRKAALQRLMTKAKDSGKKADQDTAIHALLNP